MYDADAIRNALIRQQDEAASEFRRANRVAEERHRLAWAAVQAVLEVIQSLHPPLPIYAFLKSRTGGITNRETITVQDTGSSGYRLPLVSGTYRDNPANDYVMSTSGRLFLMTFHRRHPHRVVGLSRNIGFYVNQMTPDEANNVIVENFSRQNYPTIAIPLNADELASIASGAVSLTQAWVSWVQSG